MQALIGCWHLAGLDADSARGLDARTLGERMTPEAASRIAGLAMTTLRSALSAARVEAREGDRIIAFGSFFVAAAAMVSRAGPIRDAGCTLAAFPEAAGMPDGFVIPRWPSARRISKSTMNDGS